MVTARGPLHSPLPAMKFAPSRLLVAVAITLPLAVSAQSSQTSPDSSVRACRILESALPGLVSFLGMLSVTESDHGLADNSRFVIHRFKTV